MLRVQDHKEIYNLKWKLFAIVYGLSNKYKKSIKKRMKLYRDSWERTIKTNSSKLIDDLNEEIEWINGLSKKEFCMMFGKKPKVKFKKSKTSKGMRNFKYSKYRGGLPKELKPKCWQDKHIEVKRRETIKVGSGE